MSACVNFTDDDLIAAISHYGRARTAAIRDFLDLQIDVSTATILRRLRKLEIQGSIRRAKTSYKTQTVWEASK